MANRRPVGDLQPKVVPFPSPVGAVPRLDRAALAPLLLGRVRTLQVVCGAILGSAVILGAASIVVVSAMSAPVEATAGLSLGLTCTAVLVILVTSRVHTAMLERAGRGPAAGLPATVVAAVLESYARATTMSFVLLDGAAALGLVVAVVTGNVRYSLVICGAAALAMLVRWPRQAAVEQLLHRRGLM